MIFRLLSLLSVAFCGVFTAFAEQLQVPDITLAPGGSAKVEISLGNEHSDLVAFQMDLTLPEGLSLAKAGCTLSSRITDEKQELVIGKLASGAIRLTSASMSLTPVSGTEGPLLTLEVKADEAFVQGTATIGNILFATSGSERVALNDVSFTINTYYTLTYKVDGEEYKTSTVAFGTKLTPETPPSKEGCTFSGWSEIPETMPAKDVVVTGSFSVNSYNVTFKYGDAVLTTAMVEYGAVILPYCSYAIDRMKRTDMNVSVFSGENVRIGYQIKFDVDHMTATYQNDIFDEGIEKNERMREEARILYVAMTRAMSSFSWIALEGRQGNCWQNLIWGEQ